MKKLFGLKVKKSIFDYNEMRFGLLELGEVSDGVGEFDYFLLSHLNYDEIEDSKFVNRAIELVKKIV